MTGCEIEGCERKHNARGWCVLHYQRWLRHGDPLTKLSPPGPTPKVSVWVCVCEEPDLGWLNECRKCRRKPLALLRVKP